MSILKSFPKHLKPRDVQRDTLLALEKQYNSGDIFVLNLPTASGKSAIALTISHWLKKAAVITPTKLLVDQYKNEYPYLHLLRSKADYYCSIFDCPVDRRPKSRKLGNLCKKSTGCEGCIKYLEDLRKARVLPYILANYHIYLAHKLYRDTVICDEAHLLVPMIKNFASKKLWHFKFRFPTNMVSRADFKKWTNDNYNRYKTDDNFLALYNELNSDGPIKYLIRVGYDMWAKTKLPEEHPVIFMEPLDISNSPAVQFMFPQGKVKKIVLMSATISRKDIEQLGLSGKKIVYIDANSVIPAQNRPIIVPREAENMSLASQQANLPKLANFIIKTALKFPEEKGLVHLPYNMVEKLKNLIRAHPDFNKIKHMMLWHTRENKTKVYNQFRELAEPGILFGSGMYEGLDLKQELCRWQIISKIPFPSLANEAIKYMADIDQEWYSWEASKILQQAFGRIVRSETDYGISFVFDKSFIRLYEQNQDLYPRWLRDSIKIEF